MSRRRERRRSSSEDHHYRQRTRSEGEIDRRREAWLIQKERERKHEMRKQKMIIEFELKRAAILKSNERSSEKELRQIEEESRDKYRDHESTRDYNRPSASKTSVMSQKCESDKGNTPIFQGPERQKFSATELRRTTVDIHRNIPVEIATIGEIKFDIIDFEEIKLKRREDEGAKPIFDREELKLREGTTSEEVEERRTVTMIDSEETGKAYHASRSLSRDRSDSRDRSRGHETRHRSKDFTGHSSVPRSDNEASLKRKSFQNQSNRDERYRESWGRSREQRKRGRYFENRARRGSMDGIMATQPHYINQVPVHVPVYNGNFLPRPIMMSPAMSVRRPWIRNSRPMRPRISFPPRFMQPRIHRPGGLPYNSRFSRMF